MEFELRNLGAVKPFDKAKFGFEISSQGELEQVKVLLISILESGQNTELVFCSESVEKECVELQKRYPKNLAIYRMPLLCFHPFIRYFNPQKWLSCDTFFMCRYDFFPSLIKYGSTCSEFILLAGTLTNFKSKNTIAKVYLKKCYSLFSKIVVSHESDKRNFIEILSISTEKLKVHDFRVDQIIWRLESARTTVSRKMGESFKLLEYVESLSPSQKCIFGSLWPDEVEILASIKNEMRPKTFIVAPHKLDKEEIQRMLNEMNKYDLSYSYIDEKTSEFEIIEALRLNKRQNHFFILGFRGILCELYSFFTYAYVGGGFGESIHSVLEPYLAGNYVFCGPKVDRSTEFKYIKDHAENRVSSISTKSEVMHNVFNLMDENLDRSPQDQINKTEVFRNLLEWLGIVK